ncbi:SMI1/KNR4 family protein [Catenuloplanes japonicus]|uniref:SMI1/KNR4 family protein n=1 Tax=Catenuloplanes japonicus TaxID=33876 RepID=UPI0006918B7A|nr:SMI1/KNR4 family protein [Catenuloplanes japonicus]
MTIIDELVRRVRPPAAPIHVGADWGSIEAALGTPLPADFKELIRRYGAGEFCDLVSLLTPDVLIAQNRDILDEERDYRDDDPEDYPYLLHPEPGGILIWGATSNGDRMCWLTEGEPDAWPVVVWQPRGAEWQLYPTGVAEFLDGWLSGRIPEVFPAEFTATAQWFDPARELAYATVGLSRSNLPPYDVRLAALLEALAPARLLMRAGPEASRQDKLATADCRWRVMYETAYRHQIRFAFPPEDLDAVREAAQRAAPAMGCRLTSSRDYAGDDLGWVLD